MLFLHLGGDKSPPSSHTYEVPLKKAYNVSIFDRDWKELSSFVVNTSVDPETIRLKTLAICHAEGWQTEVYVDEIPELNEDIIREMVDQFGRPPRPRTDASHTVEIMHPTTSTDAPFTNCLFPPDNAYIDG